MAREGRNPDEITPRIGADEWVAREEERLERRHGLVGRAQALLDRVPPAVLLGVFLTIAAVLPLLMNTGDLNRYGLNAAIFALLALGLNVTVGWTGLLDLGYVAFFGFGAYVYALLSSPHCFTETACGVHWPGWATIPIAVAATAVLGFLVGLPSRRLSGDYLAIVTLFFAQLFLTVAANGDRVSALGLTGGVNLTGGPNGVPSVDPIEIFFIRPTTVEAYYLFTLVSLAAVAIVLWFLIHSRTGRAWMSLREDALAAELMGMPVNSLKLLAFSIGAAVAGLAGAILAAEQTGVFPGNFDISILITIYAMVILGGAGSMPGVVLGAILITVVFEVLSPTTSAEKISMLFYGVLLVTLLVKIRPLRRLAFVLGATVGLAYAARVIAEAVSPTWTQGHVLAGGFVGDVVGAVAVVPVDPGDWPKYAYVLLVAAVLALTQLDGWRRTLLIPPTLVLTIFVWETLLVQEPAITRFILFGALLVVMMAVRPQGLLGKPRVEVV
jgi:branched-chain amino acid transport system permease protein